MLKVDMDKIYCHYLRQLNLEFCIEQISFVLTTCEYATAYQLHIVAFNKSNQLQCRRSHENCLFLLNNLLLQITQVLFSSLLIKQCTVTIWTMNVEDKY